MRVRGVSSVACAALLAIVCSGDRIAAQSSADLQRKLDKLHAFPELIVFNGSIATMDKAMTNVQAMAVRNGRILATGTNDEIKFLAGPATTMLDAKGRRVLPGIIDSHTHPQAWAIKHYAQDTIDYATKYDPQLIVHYIKGDSTVALINGAEGTIRAKAKELGPGKWIWIAMWSPDESVADSILRLKLITRDWLDRVAPENPVMIEGPNSLGPQLNNSLAKKVQEQILGREVTGLRALYTVPYDIILRGRLEAIADIITKEMNSCLIPYGITTIVGHIESPETLRAMSWLDRKGGLPVRWGWIHRMGYSLAKDPVEFYTLFGDMRGQGSDRFWTIGAGEESWEDTKTYSCTKAVALPRAGKEDTGVVGRGYRTCPTDPSQITYETAGYRALKATLESGIRPTFLHAYSDGSYDALFHLIEEAIAGGRITLEQVREARIGVEHNQVIRPDQAEKLAKYGIVMSFQGYQLQAKAKGLSYLKQFGEQYMKWMAPVKWVEDAGVTVTFNTDVHLTRTTPEARVLEFPEAWDNSIFPLYEFFITRQVSGRIFSPEQAINRLQIMKGATNNGAYYAFKEKDLGSLEVGKFADFIIIDKDYFTIPDREIHTIKNLMTVIGGKVVFTSPEF